MGIWTPGPGATEGDDTFTGDDNFETADGLGGNDVLNGGGGDDILIGGEGDDVLDGGEHPDRLIGGAGADLLDGGSNVIFGSTFDVADYVDSPAAVTIDLTAATASGGHAQGDTIVAVEALVGSAFADTLIGHAEQNQLLGGDGDDRLEGLAEDDTLAGGRGDDLLFGGDGDDMLGNGDATIHDFFVDFVADPHPTGADAIDGGAGVDTALLVYTDRAADIAFALGADGVASTVLVGGVAEGTVVNVEHLVFHAGSGDDQIAGGALEDNFSGGAGNDTLRGGGAFDSLSGDDGDDEIFGEAGDDELFGAAGADTVDGGDGDDLLRGDDPLGGFGDDILIGGAGHDRLVGERGADVLSGDAGDDELRGDEDNDHLMGGDGNDFLSGSSGIDRVEGGAGDDTIDDLDSDSDVYLGGDGDDRFTSLGISAGPGDVDTIFGGSETADSGIDTLDYSILNSNGVTVQLGAGYATFNGVLITLFSGIENVVGTNVSFGQDVLIGNEANNVLLAGTGSDWLVGGGGDDTFGISVEFSNVDHIFGDAGSDTLDFFTPFGGFPFSGVIVQLSGYATASSGQLIALFSGIENVRGTFEDDVLVGDDNANQFTDLGGDDWLVGGGGDDVFVKQIESGSVDRIFGGSGIDTIQYGSGAGVIIQLSGYVTTTAGVLMATFNGIENAVGTSGADALIGDGADNRLRGGSGSDWLVGGGGDDWFEQRPDASVDRIFGGSADADAGFDTIDYSLALGSGVVVQLSGYATSRTGALLATFSGIEAAVGTGFDDALIGNAADNRLTGAAGADWLVGGEGADTFVYRTIGDGAGDSIRDFSQIENDLIDLSAIDADPTTGGDDIFAFSAVRHAGVAGEAVVTNFGASSLVSLYLDADEIADMTIQVVHQNEVIMNADDFLF